MTRFLYVLSIGPVQDFIAAARRTRDLWFGSFLLSEISKAAANSIATSGGELIFPAPGENCENLKQPVESIDAFNVSNIILALIPDGTDLKKLSDNAQDAAKTCWIEFTNKVETDASGLIISEIWKKQVEDVIECNAAWVPFEKDEEYQKKRKRLMHLLAGRKAIRNFDQSDIQWRVNKSSLDGARESVIDKEKRDKISTTLAIQMRLSEGEELCAIGLTKRLGWGRVPFPSLTRVAIDPGIRGVNKDPKGKEILKKIEILCKGGEKGNFPYSFSTGTGKIYQDFNCDGQVLFPNRLEQIILKLNKQKYQNGKELEVLSEIRKYTSILHKNQDQGGFGEPDPYLAILVADGDKMGEAISRIENYADHKKFSETLSGFAGEARKIVMYNHGSLVYSGGDDVLAFLPVDSCIKAARELHNCFGDLLKDYAKKDGDRGSPTLSVGIAIGHKLVPLEDLLEYGREAERNAKKPDRNGFAVHLYTRSGGDPIKLREQWDQKDDRDSLDLRLNKWVELYKNDLFPDKAAYDLKQLAESYKGWKNEEVPELLLIKDIHRLLMRKRSGQGKYELLDTDIKYIVKHAKTCDTLCHLADELILARRIEISDRQTRTVNSEVQK